MTNQPQPSELSELREKLAAIEHERWSDWQKWCHKILRENLRYNDMETNLEEILERWEKQIATPYSKLSNKEKASDMEQVDRYWPLISQALAQAEVRSNEYKDALEDMVWQFGYKADGKGRRPASLFTGGLSALEHAFDVLGWLDPKPCPEGECVVKGCHNWATCGTPKGAKNGQYMSCCGTHYRLADLGGTFDIKPDRIKALEQKGASNE